MTFRLALSGLNAASADLGVTANNIANSATTGFKESRTEFAELFAVSPQGVATLAAGNGVRVSDISQQFGQGNIDFTDSNLDLAISGPGFFTLSDGGAHGLHARRRIQDRRRRAMWSTPRVQRLQVYPPLVGGGFNTGSLTDLRLISAESAPAATTNVEMLMNLPANATVPATATFDPADPTSFNRATSLTVYDSLGAAHTATMYFVKGAASGEWDARLYVDGTAVGGAQHAGIQQHRPADNAGQWRRCLPGLHARHRRGRHDHHLRFHRCARSTAAPSASTTSRRMATPPVA